MDILSIFYLTMEELSILLLPTNPGTPPGQGEADMTYAIQDGPDFYVFAGADEDEEPVTVYHAPVTVKDDDIRQAQVARLWFKGEHPEIKLSAA